MAAFNDFNGVPCTCNKYLLKDVLRKQLGFDGVVISDKSRCGADTAQCATMLRMRLTLRSMQDRHYYGV